jgi:hypothetical protein
MITAPNTKNIGGARRVDSPTVFTLKYSKNSNIRQAAKVWNISFTKIENLLKWTQLSD